MSLFKHDKSYYAVNEIKRINIHYDYEVTEGDKLALKPTWWTKDYPKKGEIKNINWEKYYDKYKNYPESIKVFTKILNIKSVDATIKMKDGKIFDFDLLSRNEVLKNFKKFSCRDVLMRDLEYEYVFNLCNSSIKMHDRVKRYDKNTIIGFNFNTFKHSQYSNSHVCDLLPIGKIDYKYSKFYLLFDPLGEHNNSINNVHEVIENSVKKYAHYYFDIFAKQIGA